MTVQGYTFAQASGSLEIRENMLKRWEKSFTQLGRLTFPVRVKQRSHQKWKLVGYGKKIAVYEWNVKS